jgi:hypothetical protein
MWCQYRPIIAIGARLAKQKIPRELDEILAAVAGGDEQAVQKLQGIAQGQQVGELGVPENKIGERVLTQDLAYLAWSLVRVQGYSLRDAAEILTTKYGAPCSHGTVSNYVDEVDAQMDDDRQLRKASMFKTLFFFVVTIIAGIVVGHFFF